LRIYRLDHFSYGLDEVLETRFAQAPAETFWRDLKYDGFHPPLDYLLVRGLERLGPADWQRKILPVAWGVGCLPVFAYLVRRRAGRRAGILAFLLLAAAPFHVRYSQELRPYSLALLLLCLSLALLDLWLERGKAWRLVALYLACLATAYTLYLAAFVLALAAAAMLVEDAFATDFPRRGRARRFLLASPVFAGLLFLGYLPWWPVVVDVAHRAPMSPRVPLSAARADRILSFFAFAPWDGEPLRAPGALYVALALAGLAVAARTPRARVLVVWAAAGLVGIEVLSQLHPHFDANRRFLPAGIAWTAAAAVGLASLATTRLRMLLAAALTAVVLLFDARSLSSYFREGRADWRVLAQWMDNHALPGETVFSENQYTQLCLGFYMSPHDRGQKASRDRIPVLNLDGEVVRLTWSWPPGTRAWLVLAGEPHFPKLRRWAEIFPADSVPPAEQAVIRRLEPALREASFARVPP
jgi:4-amino-4-deoxy-L-arabinose transferase-like glycosyltransferase